MSANLRAAQFLSKMLAQRLLADAKMLGDFGLGEAKSRSALDEGALFGGRLIFGGHLPFLSLCFPHRPPPAAARTGPPRGARPHSFDLQRLGGAP
jgi:hypothetical protein